MFDISEKLILEQSDVIFGVTPIIGKILHGNNHLLSMMKKSSVSRMQRFMYFQILCCLLDKWIRDQHQILLGNSSWIGSKIHHNTELWTQVTENRWNSSGILSQESAHCSSSKKSKSWWTKWANQNNSKDEISCSMTPGDELKTMKIVYFFAKGFEQDIGLCDMGNVYVFYIASTCTHGEELLRQSAFHQKYIRSHNETDVQHNWEIDNRTRRDLWSGNNWLGRLFMEVFVFYWWRKSLINLQRTSLRLFRFCIVSW